MATFNINSYQGKSNYALTNTFMHMVYQYVNEVRWGCKTIVLNFNMTQLFLGFRVNGSNPR